MFTKIESNSNNIAVVLVRSESHTSGEFSASELSSTEGTKQEDDTMGIITV